MGPHDRTGYDDAPLRIVSFGGGIQTLYLTEKVIEGEIEADAFIFADTQWEPEKVYEQITWAIDRIEDAGYPFYMGTEGNLREDYLRSAKGEGRCASIPAYTKEGMALGKAWRACTVDYKINVVRKVIREEILELEPKKRIPKGFQVDMIIGMSTDEATRMSVSGVDWIRHTYPLCDSPKGTGALVNRLDCRTYLEKKYPGRQFHKSACIGCPFHSDAEWLRIKENPKEWADAVEFDREIRNHVKFRSELYLHRSRKPLDEVELDGENQQDLFDNECKGFCGV